MPKQEFFRDLEVRLKGLPPFERDNIVRVYEELFIKAQANGKTEQELIDSLGLEHWTANAVPPARASSLDGSLRSLIASVALGCFNLFLLGPFIAVCSVLFSLSVTAFVLMLCPVAIVLNAVSRGMPDVWLIDLFAAMATGGAGVLLALGMWTAVAWFFRGVAKYVRLNVRLIKGE